MRRVLKFPEEAPGQDEPILSGGFISSLRVKAFWRKGKNNRLGLIKDYRDRYSMGDLICGIAIAVLPMTVIAILLLALS